MLRQSRAFLPPFLERIDRNEQTRKQDGYEIKDAGDGVININGSDHVITLHIYVGSEDDEPTQANEKTVKTYKGIIGYIDRFCS